jgi:hypothetical protein
MNRRNAIKKTAGVVGSVALTPTLLSLLESCQSKPREGFIPKALNDEQALLISELADTLLPKTQTPGALDLNVDLFIDSFIDAVIPVEGKAEFLSQISSWDEKCRRTMGDSFTALSLDQKHKFLMEEEKNSPKYNGSVWGTAVGVQEPVGFYRSMKSMMLWAFFSSEYVGKNMLNYDPIPGAYVGCVPLADIVNTWSL